MSTTTIVEGFAEKPVLSRRLLEQLAATRPHGFELTPEDVASWWEITWPLLLEYARPDEPLRRRLAVWWRKVRPDELEAAIARRKALEDAEESKRLEAAREEADAAFVGAPLVRFDHRRRP